LSEKSGTGLSRKDVRRETLQRVVDELRPLSPRKRVDYLISRPDCAGILARLPVQDIFELVKEVGVADCMELLELAPHKVLQGFVDLGVWNRDRLDPRLLASFYTALFHANPDKAADKVLLMDLELVTLFLKLHTRVIEIVDGISDEDVDDYVTMPDNKAKIAFVDPPGLPEDEGDPFGLGDKGRRLARHAARQLTEALVRKDPAAASKFFDNVRYELPSQLEEEALRWRAGRLEDLGFPPREEALAVLQYVDPDVGALPLPAPPLPSHEEDEADLALTLFVEPDEDAREPFISAGLAAMTPDELTRTKREMVALANRVSVARAAPPSETDALQAVVRETRTMVDLGLAYRAQGDLARAPELLRTTALQAFFQIGNSLTLKLQRQAQKLVRPERGTARELAGMLDAPGGLALAALLGKQPAFFTGLSKPGELQTRQFATLEDLAVGARSLAESAFRLALGFDVLGVSREELKGAALTGTNLGDAGELTLEILFTTALAHVAAGGELSAQPLGVTELQRVRDALQEVANVERAGKALADVAGPKAPLPGAKSADEVRGRVQALAGVLLTRLDEEMRNIPPADAVDPRFVTRALVKLP